MWEVLGHRDWYDPLVSAQWSRRWWRLKAKLRQRWKHRAVYELVALWTLTQQPVELSSRRSEGEQSQEALSRVEAVQALEQRRCSDEQLKRLVVWLCLLQML